MYDLRKAYNNLGNVLQQLEKNHLIYILNKIMNEMCDSLLLHQILVILVSSKLNVVTEKV